MSKLKKNLFIFLSALLLLTAATVALLQFLPANADGSLVLPGNTATFTVENDMSVVNQNYDSRWTYNRETNEWRSSKNLNRPDNGTSLKLTVVEPGNMVFSWKVGSSSGNSAVLITKTHAGEEAVAVVDQKELLSTVWKTYTEYTGPVTIQDLQKGDVVEFKWISDSVTSSSTYCLMIKGLSLPTNEFSITAKVAEDSVNHGQIKTEKEEETFDGANNQLVVTRGYNESVTFTAVPEDGYIAYWKNSSGQFVSHVAELTISNISQSKTPEDNIYTVYFVKLDDNGTKISYDGQVEGKAYFVKNTLEGGIDEYKVEDLQKLAKEDTVGLYIEFKGEKYVSLDRIMVNANRLSALSDSCYVDNDSISIPNGAENINFHVTGEGYHVIKIIVDFSSFGSSIDGGPMTSSSIQEGDSYTIKNIRFQEKGNPFTETIKVKYNPHYSELYFGDALQEAEDSNTVIEKVLTVPLVDEYTVTVKPKKEVVSSLDSSQMAEIVYKSGTANAQYFKSTSSGYKEFYPEFQSQPDGSVTLTISRFALQYSINAKLDNTTRAQTFTLDEGAESLELEISYMERAPIPKISAIKTVDGQGDDIDSITDGQVIGFPFLHDNSLSLRIQKIQGLEKEDFSVLVNNVEQNTALEPYENMFLLPIRDVGSTEVVIRYLKKSDTIDFSAYSLSFRIGEFPEEDSDGTDISQTIHLDENSGSASLKVTATDMVHYNRPPTWLFNPALSEEGNYAYTTSSQIIQSREYYKGESNLKYLMFQLSGEAQGSLTFQFRASGYIDTTISGSYRGGLLYAAPQSAVSSFVNYETYCESDDGIIWTDPDSAATLLAKPNSATGMEYGNTVVPLEDGWYQASIPITSSGAIYLLFVTYYPSDVSYPLTAIPIASASIRDVRVVTGEKDVTVSVCDKAGEATATVTVGEVPHKSGEEGFKVTAGTLVNLSVDKKGKKFYGWSVNGQFVSAEETASIFINADSNIKAWIADDGDYEARTEGTFYESINAAVDAARSGQTVIVINEATINQNITIEKGVTLLLPYSAAGKLTETGTPDINSKNKIAWIADSETYRYLTVTIKANVIITVNGTLAVGGIVNYPKGQGYQGHTSGAYSELILEKGSKIQVASGGVMDVYGRVWGGESKTGTNMGTIDVAEGGKLYQPFLILDYTGGTNALGLFMNGQTPFRRYAMINIECPLTVHYGGMLYGHASLWIETFKMLASLDQPFVSYDMGGKLGGDGNGNDTFVMLHEGSSVTITYEPTKVIKQPTVADCTEGIGLTKMVFEGGATFSYMLFSAMGISVPTNSVYFSIPYNYEVELNDFESPKDENHAQYETKTDFMIMPGGVVKVGKGATLTLNANTWIYDGLKQGKLSGKGYPTAEQLDGVYSKSGNLMVDGTLKIGKKTTVQQFELFEPAEPFIPKEIPAIFLGIIQTNGTTGKIIIPEETKLGGTIVDGADGTNYFAYTTTARVWDAAHNCFGNLEAGHTYTATSGDPFTLSELKYSNTKDSKEDNLTLTLGVTMRGSWKIEHAHHQYDWTLKEGEQNFGSEKTKDITRQCTELGCTQSETRTLLKVSENLSIGSVVYDGENVTAEDLTALFKTYFGKDDVEVTVQFEPQKNHGTYDVTIQVSGNLFFYVSGETFDLQEYKFKYTITPATITEFTLKESRAYNGNALDKAGVIESVKAGNLTLADGDYEIVITGDDSTHTNAGEYQITINVTNQNFTGTLDSQTYTITPAAIDFVELTSTSKTYDKQGVNKDTIVKTVKSGNFELEKTEYTVEIDKQTSSVGEYTITVKGQGNYNGTKTAKFTINKAQVTLTVDGKSASYNSDGNYDLTWELVSVDGFFGEYDAEEALKMLTITCDVNTNNTVGNHAINAVLNAEYSWSGKAGELENFTVTCKGGTYNISPAGYGELHFGGDETVVYDGKPHERTLTLDDETVTVKIYYKLHGAGDGEYKEQKPVNAGTYDVKAVLQSENYNNGDKFTFTGGKLVINPATIDGLTLTETSKKYDKQAITPAELVESVTAGSLTLQKGDYDVNVDKQTATVGDYTITVTGKGNYTGQKTATYKIEKKDITVTVYDQEKDYDTNSPTIAQSGENVLKIADLCAGDDLGITLGLGTNASKKDKGDYPIIPAIGGTVVANNYNITFKNGTGVTFTLTDETHVNYPMYHIKAIKATVTIDNVTDKIYGDEVVTTFTHKTSGFLNDGYIAKIKYTCNLGERPAANETGYDITGEVANLNDNYEIEVKPGKYIIKQKSITVTIADQTSEYSGKEPAIDGTKWTEDGKIGEDELNITLKKKEGFNVGEYDITGTCGNANYDVTWKNGTFTITKKPVSGIMVIVSDGTNDYSDSGDGVIHAKFGGQPLTIRAGAPNPYQDLLVETSVTEITETGSYTVTARIVETNYSGEITVKIEVAPDLSIALERLAALKAQLSGEELTAKDFGVMKQINDLINGLAEEDRESDELNEYKELIESWNAAAEVEEKVIEEAKNVADSVIGTVISVLSAVLALAYVALKGGIL